MRDALPHLFETAPDLLYQLVTMVSPKQLQVGQRCLLVLPGSVLHPEMVIRHTHLLLSAHEAACWPTA